MSKIPGFIKRNLKMVITTSVAVLVIAGLSTALVLTNLGSSGRGGSRGGRAMATSYTQRSEERSERSERTSRGCGEEDCERGNRAGRSRVELTEEQIAERAENARERLAQKLADDEITQEEYEERLAAIEAGDFRGGRSSRSNRTRGWCGDEDCERGNRTREDSDNDRVERSNRVNGDNSDDEPEVEDYDNDASDSDYDDDDTNE
ncbi:MAG: hypothetical protein FWD05_05900 [Oscillospiraceae bacterium]|nr:hypothetical protein [Oscillospiraceae bacterium]